MGEKGLGDMDAGFWFYRNQVVSDLTTCQTKAKKRTLHVSPLCVTRGTVFCLLIETDNKVSQMMDQEFFCVRPCVCFVCACLFGFCISLRV